MNLNSRKARPVERKEFGYRDDRLILIACDDTFAPKQYFGFFSLPRVQVHVVATTDGSSSASHVLQRLLAIEVLEDDERWLLLDTDHYIHGAHLASFTETLQAANQAGIRVALSRPCFEVWLLLHHLESSAVVNLANAGEVTDLLSETLGGYRKNDLQKKDYPMEAVERAYREAKQLDSTVSGGVIPLANTTRVFVLWESICKIIPSGRKPAELVSIG